MLKKFAGYYNRHIVLLILDLTCALILAGIDLVFPSILSRFIDDVIPSKGLRTVLLIGVFLLIINLVRAFLQYIITYYGHVLGSHIEYDMRNELFNHIQKLPFKFFDNNRTGSLMSRIISDLFDIAEVAHHALEDSFISVLMIVGSSVILFTYNWKMAIITYILVPLIVISTDRFNVKVRKAYRYRMEKISDLNARINDSITGIRVVKSFNNEEYEANKFKEVNKDWLRAFRDQNRIYAYFFSMMDFITSMINVIILITGAIFVYFNSLTVGQLIAFLFYANLFINPIKKLIGLNESIQRARTGFDRFMEIMSEKADEYDREGSINLTKAKGDISFKNVCFSYNKDEVILNNISLNLNSGTSVAIVGPSGAGKSTLCNLIPRFYEIDSGEITIDNINIENITLKSIRNNIGIVHQDVFLFSGTILENIEYGKIGANREEIINASIQANAHEFIMALPQGYETYIGERGIKLSGGQKQRIAIARMILKNPPILILDEATSALDNETERIIKQSLNSLSHGKTTFIIAHRLSTVKDADLIIVLTKNGIEECGKHDELLKQNGVYSKLYQHELKADF